MPFRRRPNRRGPRTGRRPGRPPGSNPRVERALARLRHANRCMETGRFEDAANIFLDLAKKAEHRGIQRAPQLYLQAGRVCVLANDQKRGLNELNYGLNLMLSYNQHRRFPPALQRVCADLRRLNQEGLAQKIEEKFADSAKKPEPAAAEDQQALLPSACPKCGAVVRPDELEWLDTSRAYCDYCGTVLGGS